MVNSLRYLNGKDYKLEWVYIVRSFGPSNITLRSPLLVRSSNLNFQPLEVVSRYRDPQLQVDENYPYLFHLRTNISKNI